jgi:hypothetical protein
MRRVRRRLVVVMEMMACSKLGPFLFVGFKLGPILFGILWSAPSRSPDPASVWKASAPSWTIR